MKVAGEGDRIPSPLNRHQVVRLGVCSEAGYVSLDSGAIPNVISNKLAKN